MSRHTIFSTLVSEVKILKKPFWKLETYSIFSTSPYFVISEAPSKIVRRTRVPCSLRYFWDKYGQPLCGWRCQISKTKHPSTFSCSNWLTRRILGHLELLTLFTIHNFFIRILISGSTLSRKSPRVSKFFGLLM